MTANNFDGEKPSRQNRRPKRSWKRPPKKALDMPPTAWHCGCTVLETPSKAVTAPVSLSGIFTTIGFSMAGSGQSIQHPLRESCQRTLDRFEVPATPYRAGLIEKSKGIIMQTFIGVTRHTSLSLYVYRFVRHFAGPVLSYRLARFARGAL